MKEEILGAVARGWCSEANKHKVMDTELASAIAEEVYALRAKELGEIREQIAHKLGWTETLALLDELIEKPTT